MQVADRSERTPSTAQSAALGNRPGNLLAVRHDLTSAFAVKSI